MAVFFTRRGLPEIVGPVAVTITANTVGSSTGKVYATVNGTKYTAAASGIEVWPGDVIEFGIWRQNTGYSTSVTVDGDTLFSITSGLTATGNWTVPDGITEIAILIQGYANNSRITVTTS